MKIFIATGKGYGQTLLSAFDAALKDCGISNFNLIQLSSIIPPGSQIISKKKLKFPDECFGYKLFLVKAEARSRETNKYIGAAVGWYQLNDGRGVFVEHHEIGESEDAVKANLALEVKKSLTDLCKSRKYQIKKSKMKMKIKVIKVEEVAACALVAAVYKYEAWD